MFTVLPGSFVFVCFLLFFLLYNLRHRSAVLASVYGIALQFGCFCFLGFFLLYNPEHQLAVLASVYAIAWQFGYFTVQPQHRSAVLAYAYGISWQFWVCLFVCLFVFWGFFFTVQPATPIYSPWFCLRYCLAVLVFCFVLGFLFVCLFCWGGGGGGGDWGFFFNCTTSNSGLQSLLVFTVLT